MRYQGLGKLVARRHALLSRKVAARILDHQKDESPDRQVRALRFGSGRRISPGHNPQASKVRLHGPRTAILACAFPSTTPLLPNGLPRLLVEVKGHFDNACAVRT